MMLVDLLLLDMIMPGMNGRETYEAISRFGRAESRYRQWFFRTDDVNEAQRMGAGC